MNTLAKIKTLCKIKKMSIWKNNFTKSWCNFKFYNYVFYLSVL